MKTAALICEYNPFHNGHAKQIEYIREHTDADRIIAIMSGDFVERGEPSVFAKGTRTLMALKSGIDAVFLLPVAYSAAGAELFARGGVAIAAGLGADYLCFGSECGNIALLTEAAHILSKEGTADSPTIQKLISEGNTFAKARALAFPKYADLISHPNNVLGIEYIIAGLSINSKLTFITHKREGAEYNEQALINGTDCQSATSIRKLIFDGRLDELKEYVPGSVLKIISAESAANRTVTPDDLSDILFTRLLSMDPNTVYSETGSDIINRISKNICRYTGFTGFADLLKTKNTTHAGIMRTLTHIMLDIKETAEYYKDVSRIKYVRLLGFRESGADVLTHIKQKGTLETVSKVPDIIRQMDAFNRSLYENDLTAATVYEYIKCRKSGDSPTPEYSKPIVIV